MRIISLSDCCWTSKCGGCWWDFSVCIQFYGYWPHKFVLKNLLSHLASCCSMEDSLNNPFHWIEWISHVFYRAINSIVNNPLQSLNFFLFSLLSRSISLLVHCACFQRYKLMRIMKKSVLYVLLVFNSILFVSDMLLPHRQAFRTWHRRPDILRGFGSLVGKKRLHIYIANRHSSFWWRLMRFMDRKLKFISIHFFAKSHVSLATITLIPMCKAFMYDSFFSF